MQKFIFTYGTSERFPFEGGWTEVYANNFGQAVMFFRAAHPDVTPGIINCSDIYSEKDFKNVFVQKMLRDGNRGYKCHEVIGILKTTKEKKAPECCICGTSLPNCKDRHDAKPVKDGVCCLRCNNVVIVPARLIMAQGDSK